MRFQIVSITERGVPNRERLHLRALVDADVGYLVIFLTRYTKVDSVFAGTGAAFWFPAKQVKAGDSIILYSGSGTVSETKDPDGSTNHFFYWGMPNTIWQDPASTVVVFETQMWQTASRPGPTPAR
jgi:hypothetical protein